MPQLTYLATERVAPQTPLALNTLAQQQVADDGLLDVRVQSGETATRLTPVVVDDREAVESGEVAVVEASAIALGDPLEPGATLVVSYQTPDQTRSRAL